MIEWLAASHKEVFVLLFCTIFCFSTRWKRFKGRSQGSLSPRSTPTIHRSGSLFSLSQFTTNWRKPQTFEHPGWESYRLFVNRQLHCCLECETSSRANRAHHLFFKWSIPNSKTTQKKIKIKIKRPEGNRFIFTAPHRLMTKYKKKKSRRLRYPVTQWVGGPHDWRQDGAKQLSDSLLIKCLSPVWQDWGRSIRASEKRHKGSLRVWSQQGRKLLPKWEPVEREKEREKEGERGRERWPRPSCFPEISRGERILGREQIK